ncbi:MAG: hypothetical protein AB8B50_12155 [Pirellulaceae bacterium]
MTTLVTVEENLKISDFDAQKLPFALPRSGAPSNRLAVGVFVFGTRFFQAFNQIPSGLPTPAELEAKELQTHLGYCIFFPDDPMGGIQLSRFDRIIHYPATWSMMA